MKLQRIMGVAVLLMGVLIFHKGYSSSISGGGITWKYIGPDSFLITVSVYANCDSTNINPGSILIEGGTCQSKTVALTKSNDFTWPELCRSIKSKCQDSKSTSTYGYSVFEFSTIVDVSDFRNNNCCNLQLSYNKCCRRKTSNAGASNLDNMYLTANLDICSNPKENAVEWREKPVFYTHLGRDVTIDFGVVADHADSVIYEFSDPRIGKNTLLSWSSIFSPHRPLTFLGFPLEKKLFPRGFHLDKKSGDVSFRPMKEESSIIKVTAKIYEDGSLMGSTSKEQHITVYRSPSNSTPQLSGFDYSPHFDLEACHGEKHEWIIGTTDKDRDDSTSILWTTNLPGAKISQTKDQHAKLAIEWTPSKDDLGRTDLYLEATVKDNACPIIMSSTKRYTFTVKSQAAVQGLYLANRTNCDAYNFSIQKPGYAEIEWFINDQFVSNSKSFDHTMQDTGTFVIKRVTNYCQLDSAFDTVRITHLNTLDIPYMGPFNVCELDTLTVIPNVTGNHGPTTYTWTQVTQHPIAYDGSSGKNVKIWFDSTVVNTPRRMQISVTDSAGCYNFDQFLVAPINFVPGSFLRDTSICANEESLYLNPDQSLNQWFYGASVVDNEALIALMKPGKNRIYSRIGDGTTCGLDSAVITLKQTPVVTAGSDFEICTTADRIQISPQPTGGRWILGNVDRENYFLHNLYETGEYELVYSYYDSTLGCAGYDTLMATVTDEPPALDIPETLSFCDNAPNQMVIGKPLGGVWTGNQIDPSNDSFLVKPGELRAPQFKFFYKLVNEAGCENQDTTTVLINRAPKAEFELLDSVYQKQEAIGIKNTTEHTTTVDYRWLVGNPAFASHNGENPSFTIDSIGRHDIRLIATDPSSGCTDTFTLETAVRITNSVLSTAADLGMAFWPNPTRDRLIISNQGLRAMEVVVVSAVGQEVLKLDAPAGESGHSLSSLKPGAYLLYFPEANAMVRELLIVE